MRGTSKTIPAKRLDWQKLAVSLVPAIVIWSICLGASPVPDAPASTTLVEISKCTTDIVLDIRYATTNNFTGKVVYPNSRCFLSKDAACALDTVQSELKSQGYRLKVFDGYRPLSVQWIFWKILPDPRFVADPRVGSRHNRGYAVDVSLVTLDGAEVAMPTEYDDFTEHARFDFAGIPEEARKNRAILRETMEKNGFEHFETEWWHFDYRGWQDKPLMDAAFDKIPEANPPCDCSQPGKNNDPVKVPRNAATP